jgi:hypothetical protein
MIPLMVESFTNDIFYIFKKRINGNVAGLIMEYYLPYGKIL